MASVSDPVVKVLCPVGLCLCASSPLWGTAARQEQENLYPMLLPLTRQSSQDPVFKQECTFMLGYWHIGYHVPRREATTQSTVSQGPRGLCMCVSFCFQGSSSRCLVTAHSLITSRSSQYHLTEDSPFPSTKLNLPTGCSLSTAHVSLPLLYSAKYISLLYFSVICYGLFASLSLSLETQRTLPRFRDFRLSYKLHPLC